MKTIFLLPITCPRPGQSKASQSQAPRPVGFVPQIQDAILDIGEVPASPTDRTEL